MVAWHLIRTKSGKENTVRCHLAHSLSEVFLPQFRATVRRWGKPVKLLAPLFPCYLFAQFDLESEYLLVKYTSGVRDLVRAGIRPVVVPDEVVADIKERCSNGPVEIPPPRLRAGDLLRVTEGPLRGLEAIFERYLSGPDRIAILINSLERLEPRVVLPAAAVEPMHGCGRLS